MAQLLATRMELLKVKRRKTLALKGHKLLKEKRDALVGEFFKIIDRVKLLRKKVDSAMAEAYLSLGIAQALMGHTQVTVAAASVPATKQLSLTQKTVMGVKVPLLQHTSESSIRQYSSLSTSVELDTAQIKFSELLPELIQLAELESALQNLSEEIKRTKRKVNALEQIMIPELGRQITYIKMRLDEMERENFSRLKIIKKRL